MKIKIMYPNQYGKLEFTKEELEKLLTDAYDEGHRDGKNSNSGYVSNYHTYSSPSVTLLGSSVCANEVTTVDCVDGLATKLTADCAGKVTANVTDISGTVTLSGVKG